MPTRFLAESICTSDQIELLSPNDEILFYRLIVNADDYGRFDARLPILKSRLFPLKNIKEAQIEQSLTALEKSGLVRRYKVVGKPYILLTGWSNFQNCRAKKSKYPSPEDADEDCAEVNDCDELHDNASDCIQMQSEVGKSKLNEDKSPVLFEMPLVDGTMWNVTENAYIEYERLYPAVNIEQEIRKMIGWLGANTKKRKTRAGIKRFINGWLSRQQDAASKMTLPQRISQINSANAHSNTFFPSGDDENPFAVVEYEGAR